MHCLGERPLFSSSFVAVFSNTLMMLYNIHYWWFFLSQGNRWTKFVHPKIQRPKPCLLMFVSLVTLDSFHLLLSTQLTANLTLEWSGWSIFHPLSHIYAKTPFCCVKTVVNNTESSMYCFWSTVSKHAPILNIVFSLINVHAKWWIHCLLISSTLLLSRATSIYDQPKRVCGVFWCFLEQLPNLGNLSVQHNLCQYDPV